MGVGGWSELHPSLFWIFGNCLTFQIPKYERIEEEDEEEEEEKKKDDDCQKDYTTLEVNMRTTHHSCKNEGTFEHCWEQQT